MSLKPQLGLTQRNGVWQYFIRINGTVFRGSCRTKDELQAREFYDRKRGELWRTSVIGDKQRRTWEETCKRWLDEHEKKRSFANDIRSAKFWSDGFARSRVVYLDEITPERVKELKEAELGRPWAGKRKGKRVIGASSVNGKIAFLRAVINAANREYLWLDTRPLFKLYPVNNSRVRFLEPHEFVRLLGFLAPPYNEMATFAVSTGLRQGNVAGLKWQYVNMTRKTVTFPDVVMKNGSPLTVPLNETAIGVVRRQIGQSDEWVFPRADGGQIRAVQSNMWNKAKEQAGIANFTWHDLRHTWASWLRQAGVGLDMIQELGGWKQYSMVQRYAHLDVTHLAKHAAVLDGVFSVLPGANTQKMHSV
jgi:integrase